MPSPDQGGGEPRPYEMRELDLTWSDREGRAYLRVGGWTQSELRVLAGLDGAELGRCLAVLPSELVEAGGDVRALQPVAGRFEIEGDAICFIPRFPFLDGRSYSLLVSGQGPRPEGRPGLSSLLPTFGPASGGQGPPEGRVGPSLPSLSGGPGEMRGPANLEVWTIQRPIPASAPTTSVLAIYPSADEVPVNQLKLYVHFSSPMSEGWANRAVHVRRADNDEPLEGVFLPMEPELWDPERRRLTLLLDPGRIKRGLAPHDEAGYPLIEGVAIIVSIDSAFRDAAGQPLRAGAEQRYNVGPPVHARVDPRSWRYECPTAGSMNGLTVAFDRPLDHALLEHSLWVIDAAGAAVTGEATAGPGEWCWWFEPGAPWKEGRHMLMVDSRLEDLAGNSLVRVFDRDLTRAEDAPVDAGPVAIDFSFAPPGANPADSPGAHRN